jgi:hypothetical protein
MLMTGGAFASTGAMGRMNGFSRSAQQSWSLIGEMQPISAKAMAIETTLSGVMVPRKSLLNGVFLAPASVRCFLYRLCPDLC